MTTIIWAPKIAGNLLLAEESVASKGLSSVAMVRFFVSKHIFMDVQTKKDMSVLGDLKTVLRMDNI